jgi:predicted DNA-binding protein
MAKRKIINEDAESEVKKILSISLPADLYQFLLEKTGKGNIGSFIREAIEEKIKKSENALVNAYKLLENNEEYEGINFQEIWENKSEKIVEQKNNAKPKQRGQKTK